MKKAKTKKVENKKVENKDNTTHKKLPSILGTPDSEEYLQTNPVTEAFIDNVIKRMLDYSRSDEALFIGNFIRDMGIPHTTFYNWLKTWPQLNEAYENAKTNVGYGRIQGAAKRRFDKGVVMHSQYRFGDEWKNDDVYQAAMRQREEDKKGVINVILPTNEQVIDREKHKPIKLEEKE